MCDSSSKQGNARPTPTERTVYFKKGAMVWRRRKPYAIH